MVQVKLLWPKTVAEQLIAPSGLSSNLQAGSCRLPVYWNVGPATWTVAHNLQPGCSYDSHAVLHLWCILENSELLIPNFISPLRSGIFLESSKTCSSWSKSEKSIIFKRKCRIFLIGDISELHKQFFYHFAWIVEKAKAKWTGHSLIVEL